MSLREQFLGLSRVIKAEFEKISSQIPHAGERGTSREEILTKSFLKKYLPERFSIGTGQIFATNRQFSLQQDAVIYDAFNCPLLLKSDRTNLFPCESVYAVIEIKSKLNSFQLKDALEKIVSAKTLPKRPLPLAIGPGIRAGGASRTLGAVFAYSLETSLPTLRKKLGELQSSIDQNYWINMICVLDKAIVAYVDPEKRNIISTPQPNFKLATWMTREDSLLLFYLLLIDHLNSSVATPPDMKAYTEASLEYPAEW